MGTSHEALKHSIIETCLRLEAAGYFVSTWGNVSARVPEGFIVTPSRIQYDLMTPDDLVTVSPEGAVLDGRRLPSSEAEVHRLVLNARDDVGAVIHSHSSCATAVACLQRPIPPFVEDLAQIVGGAINCTRYVPGSHHRQLAEEVVARLGEVNAVLLANHGVLCCGRDLAEAFVTSQIVERAAFMMLSAASIGPVTVIPPQEVEAERHRFLYKYGTKDDFDEAE
ncbi:MAG: class II aldolase/adducin family protein [Candidatus Brocadiae bacterium]|nr:class II aldolase/adducin family protein [Candidatus Brocadiia bacterium]